MHTFQKFHISLFFLFVALPGLNGANKSVNFLTYSCSGSDNFEPGGAYNTNLNLLLSNLTSNAQQSMFYNFTVGDTTDKVYGLFLCRGDTTTQICNDCVTAAARAVQLQCPFAVGAMVWYEECILRYSDTYMFGIALDRPFYILHLEPSNYEQYEDTISSTLRDLISKAAFSNSSLAFARKVVNVTSSLILDCYAECTPDIIGSGCNRCLEAAFGRLESFSSGDKYAILLQPSCRLRYIFNETVGAPSTPPIN